MFKQVPSFNILFAMVVLALAFGGCRDNPQRHRMAAGRMDNSFRQASGILQLVTVDWDGDGAPNPEPPFLAKPAERYYDYVSPDGRWSKRITTSRKGALLHELDVHYTGVKFDEPDEDEQRKEEVSVHYDYVTKQYRLSYYGKNATVRKLLVRVPGSDVGSFSAEVQGDAKDIREVYQTILHELK